MAEGTSYSYDPLMLAGFRDTAMHTGYGDAAPNLSSASPKTSTVLLEDRVIVSTWNKAGNNAADPVSAVLMHAALTNEFVIDPAITAGTDWVVTFPTKKFYVGMGTAPPLTISVPPPAPLPIIPPPGDGPAPGGPPLAPLPLREALALNTNNVFERPFSNDFWRGGACEPYVSRIYNRQEKAVESFGGLPRLSCPPNSVLV